MNEQNEFNRLIVLEDLASFSLGKKMVVLRNGLGDKVKLDVAIGVVPDDFSVYGSDEYFIDMVLADSKIDIETQLGADYISRYPEGNNVRYLIDASLKKNSPLNGPFLYNLQRHGPMLRCTPESYLTGNLQLLARQGAVKDFQQRKIKEKIGALSRLL